MTRLVKWILGIGSVTFLFVLAVRFFHQTPLSYHRLPVSFSNQQLPYVSIEIQGKSYSLLMDTGASYALSLNNEILRTLKKKQTDFHELVDIKGDTWFTPSYKIERVHFAGHLFPSLSVTEITQEHRDNTWLRRAVIAQEEPSKPCFGIIGRSLLEKKDLLLDFLHQAVYTVDHPKGLEQLHIALDTFTKVPFVKTPAGYILHVQTDLGVLRFLIDTGCTLTMVKPHAFNWEIQEEYHYGTVRFYTKTFAMGGKNFGGGYIYLFDLDPDPSEMDGFIGMDFLRCHLIYIDQKENMLYIKPNT